MIVRVHVCSIGKQELTELFVASEGCKLQRSHPFLKTDVKKWNIRETKKYKNSSLIEPLAQTKSIYDFKLFQEKIRFI